MNMKFVLPVLFFVAPICALAEQQPDSLAIVGSPRVYAYDGSHGAGALPEIYGLQNNWRDELPASRRTGDTIKKGNALYEIDLIRWMPPGCPDCRKSKTKAYL